MELSPKTEKALNAQLNAEMYSSNLYLSMAAWFDARMLRGFAGWMRAQATEEMGHALRFYNYLVERGNRVKIQAIAAPPTEWGSPVAVFEQALKHEQKVTGMIHDLVNQAVAERDHATQIMLQWFVSEQVEEESSAAEMLDKLKTLSKTPAGIVILDAEAAKRKAEAE